jgi:hypothetical protein
MDVRWPASRVGCTDEILGTALPGSARHACDLFLIAQQYVGCLGSVTVPL